MWSTFLEYTGDDTYNLYVKGSFVLISILFWGVGSIYTYVDLVVKNPAIKKYKVQENTNQSITKQQLWNLLGVVVFNQTVVLLSFAILSYKLAKMRGIPDIRSLPSLPQVVLDLAVSNVVVEVCFFYSHRLVHHPLLYRRIHKMHHSWTSPIALASVYCHPVEHVMVNLLSLGLGPLLMGSHILTCWIWFSIAILSTLNDHSGYHLPWFPSPEFHDFHHLKFSECYGASSGLLDYLHGTDKMFRSSVQYRRNKILTGKSSARERFPG